MSNVLNILKLLNPEAGSLSFVFFMWEKIRRLFRFAIPSDWSIGFRPIKRLNQAKNGFIYPLIGLNAKEWKRSEDSQLIWSWIHRQKKRERKAFCEKRRKTQSSLNQQQQPSSWLCNSALLWQLEERRQAALFLASCSLAVAWQESSCPSLPWPPCLLTQAKHYLSLCSCNCDSVAWTER